MSRQESGLTDRQTDTSNESVGGGGEGGTRPGSRSGFWGHYQSPAPGKARPISFHFVMPVDKTCAISVIEKIAILVF